MEIATILGVGKPRGTAGGKGGEKERGWRGRGQVKFFTVYLSRGRIRGTIKSEGNRRIGE